jgi:general secretion pathway protein G
MNDERGTMNKNEITMIVPPASGGSSFIVHRSSFENGFTLIELLVVVTIIGILAGIAMVQVGRAHTKAREAALRADLHEMRKAIDDFYADKQHFPTSLEELKPKYLRDIPKDPITGAKDWVTVSDAPGTEDSAAPEPTEADSATGQQPGISDVHSNAKGMTLDKVPYDQL